MPLLLQQGHSHYPPYTPSRYLSIGPPPWAFGPSGFRRQWQSKRAAVIATHVRLSILRLCLRALPIGRPLAALLMNVFVGGLLVGWDGIRYARSQFTAQLVNRHNWYITTEGRYRGIVAFGGRV